MLWYMLMDTFFWRYRKENKKFQVFKPEIIQFFNGYPKLEYNVSYSLCITSLLFDVIILLFFPLDAMPRGAAWSESISVRGVAWWSRNMLDLLQWMRVQRVWGRIFVSFVWMYCMNLLIYWKTNICVFQKRKKTKQKNTGTVTVAIMCENMSVNHTSGQNHCLSETSPPQFFQHADTDASSYYF